MPTVLFSFIIPHYLNHRMIMTGYIRRIVLASALTILSACAVDGDRESGSAASDTIASPVSDVELTGRPAPLSSSSETEQATDSQARLADPTARGCEAQGVGVEEAFAGRMCDAAEDLGFSATHVHSFGAGGVDVFLTQENATSLLADPARLRSQTAALTEWAKQHYEGFNAVEVTIVGPERKIARGKKISTGTVSVELF